MHEVCIMVHLDLERCQEVVHLKSFLAFWLGWIGEKPIMMDRIMRKVFVQSYYMGLIRQFIREKEATCHFYPFIIFHG